MTQRRFNEAEVAAIFKRATEAQLPRQQQLSSGSDGLSLAQPQEIGREVGIAPELVVEAAKLLDRRVSMTSRRFMGFPIGVGRTIDLDRRLSESEWEQFVVDLRETFDARGTVKSDGSFRQWTNGNLQALLEPTPTGHRIRLRTTRGNALAWMSGAMVMIGLAAATSVATFVGGAGAASLTAVTELAVIGAGLFAAGALRLPGWARLRGKQMEQVAGRLAQTPGSPLLEESRDDL